METEKKKKKITCALHRKKEIKEDERKEIKEDERKEIKEDERKERNEKVK